MRNPLKELMRYSISRVFLLKKAKDLGDICMHLRNLKIWPLTCMICVSELRSFAISLTKAISIR